MAETVLKRKDTTLVVRRFILFMSVRRLSHGEKQWRAHKGNNILFSRTKGHA